MKHTKKLIPAIGMLLLSACMLVTSTFAWFSMNTEVTATGMTVGAKGDQVYLQIVKGVQTSAFSNSEAQTSADAEMSVLDLQPANVVKTFTTSSYEAFTTKAEGLKWVTNTSATVDTSTGVGQYKEVTTPETAYLLSSFMIRLNATAGKTEATAPLTVKQVNFSGVATPTDKFAHCVSVLVVCGNNAQLFKQTTTTTTTMVEGEEVPVTNYNIGTFAKVGDAYLDATTITPAEGGEAYTVFNNTVGVQVDIYVFFDGENPNCTIAQLNAAKQAAVTSYGIDVVFTCNG